MRRIVSAIVNIILIIILPLLLKPELILNYKIIIIEIVVFILWLTQPEFSIQETKQQKESDRFTVILILVMSVISIVVPVIQWAYFENGDSNFGLLCWIGVFFIIAGVWVRVWSIMQLGAFFTSTVQIKDEHSLVESGPYALVRHPGYLGAFLCITSGPLILNSAFGYVIACISMGIAYYYRIKIEEERLLAYFGQTYENYRKKTKSIIPFIL